MNLKKILALLKIILVAIFCNFCIDGDSQVLTLPTNDFDIMVGIDNYPSWTGFNLTQDFGYNGKVLMGINPNGPVRDIFGIVTSYGGVNPVLIDTKLSLKSDGGAFFKGIVDMQSNLKINRSAYALNPPKMIFNYDDGISGTSDPNFNIYMDNRDKLIINRATSEYQQIPVMSFWDDFGTGFSKVGIGTTFPTEVLDVVGNIKSTGLISGNSVLGNTSINGNAIINGSITSYNSINAGDYLSLNNNLSGYTLKIKTVGDDNWGIEHSSQINYSSSSEFYGMGLRIMDNASNGFYIRDKVTNSNRLVIRNGKLGIGTDDPQFKLDVSGIVNATDIYKDGESIMTWIKNGSDIKFDNGYGKVGIRRDPFFTLDVAGTINGNQLLKNGQRIDWWQQGLGNPTSIYYNEGIVGIGDNTPEDNTIPDLKLAVNGTIKCKQIIVTLSNWPDYVFKSGYNLLPIEDLEKRIIEDGHLPDVPSEVEVIKNGISLGSMSEILLKKVEELSLYVIQLNKKIEELQMENKRLNEKENISK